MTNRLIIDPPRSRRLFKLVLLALVVLAAGIGLYIKNDFTDNAPLAASRKSHPQAPAEAVVQASPSSRSPILPPPQTNETRSQQFDRLARGTPADILLALKLLEPCEKADVAKMRLAAPTPDNDDVDWRQKENAKVAATATAADSECIGITAGQRSQAISLAIKAAQSGIKGGFDALVRQENLSALGADFSKGDPRDPLIIQAMPAIWDAYIKAGDPHALIAASNREANCDFPPQCQGMDKRLALVHWTAYTDTGDSKYPTDGVTRDLSSQLPPDVAQAAIAEGHALYANRTNK